MFNLRETILVAFMIAFVSGMSWALYWISDHMAFWNFMLFGVVTFGVMLALGCAHDWHHKRGFPWDWIHR
jgi:hypothetical protein